VSTTACSAEKLQELEDRERQAWSDYSDRIRELTGAEYEQAEHESWERLQRELRSLERRRTSLEKPPVERPPAREPR
jgi:cell division septum initiation protein DivIVA